MVMLASLVVAAGVAMVGAIGWGWSRGTLAETHQERIDHEFHRIVSRLRHHRD